MLRILALLFLAAVTGATFAANDWVNMLVQDPTGGLVANHLCYSTNGHDIFCDAGAPFITGGTLYVPTYVSSTNGSHQQAIRSQRATNAIFDVDQPALEELPVGQKRAHFLLVDVLDMNRALPAQSHHLRDAAGISSAPWIEFSGRPTRLVPPNLGHGVFRRLAQFTIPCKIQLVMRSLIKVFLRW
jgi:hypothetical protein